MHEPIYDEIREQTSLFSVIDENEDSNMSLETLREPKSLFSDYEDLEPPSVQSDHQTDEKTQKVTFWRRQFRREITTKQRKFDWVFGVALPIICFAFDPIVFRGGIDDGGWLGDYRLFAYVLSIVSIMSMAAWLLWSEKLGSLVPFLAGLFAVSSAVSFLVGLALLPLSSLGLILLIGVLGFTPLLSSFVYLRNSYRAYFIHDLFGETKYTTRAFILAAIFGLITPFVIHQQFTVRMAVPDELTFTAD